MGVGGGEALELADTLECLWSEAVRRRLRDGKNVSNELTVEDKQARGLSFFRLLLLSSVG